MPLRKGAPEPHPTPLSMKATSLTAESPAVDCLRAHALGTGVHGVHRPFTCLRLLQSVDDLTPIRVQTLFSTIPDAVGARGEGAWGKREDGMAIGGH